MKSVRNYFSSLSQLWKSNERQCLTLSPSSIHFTDSSIADFSSTSIDERLLIEISRKLVDSRSPPKLQICTHENNWFALNNSHLLVYRQLEHIGLCPTVVCDVVRIENIPDGIRKMLKPTRQDEVIYCAEKQVDSCVYSDEEELCPSSSNSNLETDDENETQ